MISRFVDERMKWEKGKSQERRKWKRCQGERNKATENDKCKWQVPGCWARFSEYKNNRVRIDQSVCSWQCNIYGVPFRSYASACGLLSFIICNFLIVDFWSSYNSTPTWSNTNPYGIAWSCNFLICFIFNLWPLQAHITISGFVWPNVMTRIDKNSASP